MAYTVYMIKARQNKNLEGAMTKKDIDTTGFGGGVPQEVREQLHNIQWGYPHDEDLVTLIDDCSEHVSNAMNTKCMVVDVHCDDGTVRIGYFADNAQTIVDECESCESCEDWANTWDERDGVVPLFVLGEPDDEETDNG